MDHMIFNLRMTRQLRNMSQEDLVVAVDGISQTKLSRIERGVMKPTEELKEKLAKALDVKPEWIDWDNKVFEYPEENEKGESTMKGDTKNEVQVQSDSPMRRKRRS